MNKIFSMLLCLTMLLGMAGCGSKPIEQPSSQLGQQLEQSESSAPTQTPENTEKPSQSTPAQSAELDEEDSFDLDDTVGETQDFSKYQEVKKDKYLTAPVPEGQQKPVEPGDIEIDHSKKKTCYLTISCATILDNMDDLAEGKEGLVPADGMILPRTEVTFYEGESVFDVLQRETQNRKIHMESNFTPMYNSAYIEGIGNLYEFDCGSESGWEYRVNGWFPNYGVSRYVVQQGDEVEFLYTCDLGRDLGANWMD